MVDRNTSADAGRKGAPSKTKLGMAQQFIPPNTKGRFLPAYGGGAGHCTTWYDPDIGTAEDEVGNDWDLDR